MRPLPGGFSIWGISLIAGGRIQTNLYPVGQGQSEKHVDLDYRQC